MNTEEQKKEASAATETRAEQVNTAQFVFKSVSMRAISQGGSPWFVMKDICSALGIQNHREVWERLDDDQKGVDQIYTPGGMQTVGIVNESGLWDVIIRSDKPEAKPFRKWITSEVLPALRKTGTYTLPNNPEFNETFTTRPGQQLLALPSQTNPQVDFAAVMDMMVGAAKAAREVRPRHREAWIRQITIGAYQTIYGADISAFLPQSDGAGFIQGSLTGSNKVGVANGDTNATSTPSLPEPPPFPSLSEKDVIKFKKLEWWSMLKLQHVTGLNQWEILCCLYDGGAAHYHQREDSLIPNVFFKGTYYIKKNGQAYWNPKLARMIEVQRPYLKTEWPIKWIVRQENKMIEEGGAK